MHGRFAGNLFALLLPLLLVKCLIWSTALGSGTSGGVLAPLLIIGGGVGAILGQFLPGGDDRLWPLIGMAAIMGGTMRSPLTGAFFALELTHDIKALPVVDPDDPTQVVGMVTRSDLLKPRARNVEEEVKRERFIAI
jgi:CIC family chloride channel protein